MKKRFALFTLLITLLQLGSLAQDRQSERPASLPLITEDGISEITASDNIDVVLIQDIAENVGVKVPDNVLGRLKISVSGGRLFLATAKNVKEGERLAVYIRINELESLTLKGNAFATSVGVLQSKNLHISAGKEARVALKSKGKVWFDAFTDYQVVKEDGYFSVNAL